MKKLLAVLAFVFLGTMTFAQGWSINGTHIHNNNTGFVGIQAGGGVFTPTDLFHIDNPNGGANFRLTRPYNPVADGVIGSFRIMNSNPTTASYFNFSFRYNTGVHEVVQSGFDHISGTFKAFMNFNLANGLYRIREGVADVQFLNTGTIAIGMGTLAVPAGAKVAIGGKVVAKEIEVTLTGMPPDFVFNSDYKLASLYDVENFINTNKHLPGVPSATEMTSNGLNVGDMNMTLLQKVEELTLYMINLQKENDALKARVSQLEK